MGRGIFVAFEGIDRTGKTSLCDGLVEQFTDETYFVDHFEFPLRYTATGRILDRYLKNEIELDDHVAHHLFSANRWEATERLQKMLSDTPVFVDRYVASGMAYSAAKGTLSVDWCMKFNAGLPKPDLTVYLEGDPSLLHQRDGYGSERYETDEFQARVKNVYELLKLNDPTWITINVDGKTRRQIQRDLYPMLIRRAREFSENNHPLTFY